MYVQYQSIASPTEEREIEHTDTHTHNKKKKEKKDLPDGCDFLSIYRQMHNDIPSPTTTTNIQHRPIRNGDHSGTCHVTTVLINTTYCLPDLLPLKKQNT